MSPPVRIGRFDPVILLDNVVRWGPVSVLTARPTRTRIVVEESSGLTPHTFTFGRTEGRC